MALLTAAFYVSGSTMNALVNPVGVAGVVMMAAFSVRSSIDGSWVATRRRLAISAALVLLGVVAAARSTPAAATTVAQVMWFAPWWALYVAAIWRDDLRNSQASRTTHALSTVVGSAAVAGIMSICTLASLSA